MTANRRLIGDPLLSAAMVDDLVVVLIDGDQICFRLRDRRLICSVCGTANEATATSCYGCDGSPVRDPVKRLGIDSPIRRR